MRVNTRITGADGSIQYLNRQGQQLGAEFQNEIIKRARALAVQIQNGISTSAAGGGVPFTNKAVLFTYKKTASGVKTTILIKEQQAQYLYDVLVKPDSISKFIPTSNARLTKQGNISGLATNLKKGRYKIIEQGGKKRLIDTNQKKKSKRVIGVREKKKRKMIYDFYQHAQDGAILIFQDIKGTFKIKRG